MNIVVVLIMEELLLILLVLFQCVVLGHISIIPFQIHGVRSTCR